MKIELDVSVRRIVTEKIYIKIEADTADQAIEKVEEALSSYPEAVEVEGVLRCLTTERQCEDLEILNVERVD